MTRSAAIQSALVRYVQRSCDLSDESAVSSRGRAAEGAPQASAKLRPTSNVCAARRQDVVFDNGDSQLKYLKDSLRNHRYGCNKKILSIHTNPSTSA
jgi:hypothetical protein